MKILFNKHVSPRPTLLIDAGLGYTVQACPAMHASTSVSKASVSPPEPYDRDPGNLAPRRTNKATAGR